MDINKSTLQSEVPDISIPLNQEGHQSIPLNQEGYKRHDIAGDVTNDAETVVKSPFMPSSTSGLPSSTPYSKNSKKLFDDTKDYFYGDSPGNDATPPEIKQAIDSLNPSVFKHIQTRIYHDVRNTFCDKIQNYIENEFESMLNKCLRAPGLFLKRLGLQYEVIECIYHVYRW